MDLAVVEQKRRRQNNNNKVKLQVGSAKLKSSSKLYLNNEGMVTLKEHGLKGKEGNKLNKEALANMSDFFAEFLKEKEGEEYASRQVMDLLGQ